jgi:hypothetical protein
MIDIFPDTFFNLNHPDAPIVYIQLRNDTSDVENPSTWLDITGNPSNFFDSMTLEDISGFQQLTLNLKDINFGTLENAIAKSISCVLYKNELMKKDDLSNTKYDLFSYKVDNNISSNLRIRFGYPRSSEENVIEPNTFEDAGWKERKDAEKTVVMTPWIYFMFLNTSFKVTDSGLQVTISAISVAGSFLEKVKLVRKFAILRDTPINILKSFQNMMSEINNGSFSVEIRQPPEKIEEEGSTTEGVIELNMGGSPEDKGINYKTLKNLIDEFCSLVPPMYINENGDPITTKEEKDKAKVNRTTIPYGYFLDNINGKPVLVFNYSNPVNSGQQKIRNYFWGAVPNSIVRELNIESQIDYASLNRQVLLVDTSGSKSGADTPNTKIRIYSDWKTDEEGIYNQLGRGRQAVIDDKFNFAFVSDVITSSSGSSNYKQNSENFAARISSQLISWVNETAFTGTITIPGDPFYLFSGNIQPYQLLIKIIVVRPDYFDGNGKYIHGEISYLSGDYLVGKIEHRIDGSNFSTTLTVLRWPIKE